MSEVTEETKEELGVEENPEGAGDPEENGEEEENTVTHLHTRQIPTIVMLAGGATAAIFTFVRHDPLLTSLEIIFVALILFLVLGDVIKILLDGITIEKKDVSENKDKVIERSTGEEQEETGGEETGESSMENVESPEEIET
ncbi:MAG: hypothetical protein IJT63_03860 [Lachnospiraceae bacterium]|nr:hypothetical protein [Lachnospiraceae bacterium]